MLEAVLIYVHPAPRIGQRTLTDEVGSALRRCHVDHIKMYPGFYLFVIGAKANEFGAFAGAIHFFQFMVKMQVNITAFTDFQKGFFVIGNRKQTGSTAPVLDVYLVEYPVFAEVIGGHVHNFVRGATALYWGVGVVENGISSLQVADAFEGVGRVFEAVIGADPIFTQGFF